MGNYLYYKGKNGKVNACEHVQEMLKGQIKLLQPKEEYPLLQACTAMKSNLRVEAILHRTLLEASRVQHRGIIFPRENP